MLTLGWLTGCGDDGETKTARYAGSFVNGADQSPIGGAEICIITPVGIPCVQTAADGSYAIDLPIKTDVEVEVKRDGFIPIRSNFVTRSSDAQISAQMFRPAAVEAAFAQAGATYDDTRCGLLVRVYDPAKGQTVGLAGVAVDLEPSDGEGPYYLDGLTFNPNANATTPIGNALFSLLEDKTYKISFTSATHDCAGTFLWHSSDGRVEAVVKPGFATYIYADCSPL
jgi:hypothetical protein